MIALLDTSVLARKLLQEPEPLEAWNDIEEAYASRLVAVEMGRLIDRLRLNGAVDDKQVVQLHQELQRVLRAIDIVGVTEEVLRGAAGPMPTILGTLDAIHLATAVELRREFGRPLTVATHDLQLGRAARAPAGHDHPIRWRQRYARARIRKMVDGYAFDPLAELLDHFENNGEAPAEWLTEHAPDGTLDRAWGKCADASAMLKLHAATGHGAGLVRAACACARAVLDRVPREETWPAKGIDVAERWARGEATDDELFDAERVASGAAADADAASAPWMDAGHAAASAVRAAAFIAKARLVDVNAASNAADAAASATDAAGSAPKPGVEYMVFERMLADLVRTLVPCPTLDQLEAGFRRRWT